MTQSPQTPTGPGWYEDEQDPTLLRYFDGIVWTAHTTPRRSPTADASTIGRATPGVIPGRAGNPGAWAQPGQAGQPGQPGQQAPGQWPGGGMPPAGQNAYSQGWTAKRGDVLPDGDVLAEWWRRLVGRILDLLVTAVITLVIAFPWVSQAASTFSDYMARAVQAAETGAAPPSQTDFAQDLLAVALPITLISVVVGLVYETAFLTTRAATPGKMMVGTYVRPADGPGPVGVVMALKRQVITAGTTLLGLVPLVSLFASGLSLLDPAWLLWDARRQALHDKVANTVVVLRNPHR